MSNQTENYEGFAIIGMSGRFPESPSVKQYWENLCAGKECISFFSEETVLEMGILPELVRDPSYVRARGVIRDIDFFDAEFFGFTPRDAEITDPQQRLFMECAWEAMESGGYSPDSFKGPVGVFAGSSLSNYLFLIHTSPELVATVGSFQIEIGNDKDFLATRTSYKLNLSGPSLSVNTACSTSLVAVTLACQSLQNHQCDMALAGGVALGAIPQRTGYNYKPGGILSPDGHCRAFDAKAKGTVGGNGLGVVFLKRLEDAVADGDPVIAVIRGFAINNDGAMKVGFTAPSVDGQAAVICEALANAAVDPGTISYVEAHGTGTILGDPIEVEALTRAFRLGTEKKQFCAIGSAKTNVGHLDAAAGMAGLIKTSLALKHAIIPPSLHYESPNPQIDFANSPFYVNARLAPWQPEAGIRRAGVSSFGIGGTNVHLVLEEAPAPWQSGASRKAQLLPLSARNVEALQQASENLKNHLSLNNTEPLADVSFTLATGRKAFAHRMACVAGSRQQAAEKLSAGEVLQGEWKGSARPLVFLLSGQGSQFVHMGRDLYEKEVVFRREMDFASEFLKPYLGCDLRDVIFAEGESEIRHAEIMLRQTWMTQPALYAFERALLKQWESWGVTPTALIGHSLGELVAANAVGVLSDEDGFILVAERGRLMWKTEPGGMLSAMTDEASAYRFVRPGVSLAAVNGKQQVVFSGAVAAMNHLELELAQAGIVYRKLDVERAFHSETMELVREEFLQVARSLKFNPPKGRFISNITGHWAGPEVAEPEYWWEQVRKPVRFASGIQQLMGEEDWMWLEVGPSELLAKLVRNEIRAAEKKSVVVASLTGAAEKNQEQTKLVSALGELWVNGAEVDWQSYYEGEKRRHLSLPTYPFQRQSYWVTFPEDQPQTQPTEQPPVKPVNTIEETASVILPVKGLDTGNQAANETEIVITRVWQQYLGMKQIGNDQNFFALGGDSLLVIQVATKLRELLEMDIPIEAFLEQPTIAGLAKKILAMKKSDLKSSVLIPMRTSGTRQPFFAVHPIGGGAFIFRDLMKHLGEEQPFYGFQALGLADIGDEGDPYISLEQMAAEYIQAMRAVQKQGPYLLSGLSWGGVLAFEMAQQLTLAGETVSLLALFDTPSPVELAKLSALDDATILVGLARDLAFQRGIELPLTAEDVQKLPANSQVQCVLNELQNCGLLSDEATGTWLRKHLQGYRSRLRLIQQYQPAVYSGKITFFRAGELDDVMTEHLDLVQVDYNRQAFAWEELSTQPVDVHIVPGNHSEIVFEPNVQILVERLNACISKSVPCTV